MIVFGCVNFTRSKSNIKDLPQKENQKPATHMNSTTPFRCIAEGTCFLGMQNQPQMKCIDPNNVAGIEIYTYQCISF